MLQQPSTIAIGDVHGCLKTLIELLTNKLRKYDQYIFLGDYINKGPDSRGVIDFLIEWGKTNQCVFLRGNHEEMLLNSYLDKNNLTFYNIGGNVALKSFNVYMVEEIPSKYIEWINKLLYHYSYNNYLFVHAGVDFTKYNFLNDKNFILTTRKTIFNKDSHHTPILIHGHTPQRLDEIINNFKNLENNKIIGIDGGCVYHKNNFEKGYLIGFDLSEKKLIFQENIDFN
jgi:serine/threonine protein phosphatase 1